MKKKKILITLFLLICTVFAVSLSASAATYKNRWVTDTKGNRYYYGSSGKKYTGGPKRIGSYYYIFDAKGRLYKNKVLKVKNKLYVSRKDGKLLTGAKIVTYSGKTYYPTKTGALKTGLQKDPNNTKKKYYFDPKTGSAVKLKWKKIGKYWYYFNGAGRAYHDACYTIKGKKYMFDSQAHRVHGVREIGNAYYGFHYKSGYMVYGWKNFSNKRYFFDKNQDGKALTNGFFRISGSVYYFNSLGQRLSGWIMIGNRRYYLDPQKNGARVYGKKAISGVTYDFGTNGYITYTPSGNLTLRVNRAKNVITAYEGNTPVKAMTCSVGLNNATPTGTFSVSTHYKWRQLNGPTMGQYCSHFSYPYYLFHSVPMNGTSRNQYNVSAADYNMLGQAASHGCIRLCVADAKWIYDNVKTGSKVIISDYEPTPLGKPAVVKMKPGTIGKDPTDIWYNP